MQERSMMKIVQDIQSPYSDNQLEAMQELLKRMDPKIKRSLLQTSFDKRADLEQELKIKIIQIARNYEWKTVPHIRNFIRFE